MPRVKVLGSVFGKVMIWNSCILMNLHYIGISVGVSTEKPCNIYSFANKTHYSLSVSLFLNADCSIQCVTQISSDLQNFS